MTPSKPRLFLVVLATTVASQDGVVAAGDSVRNRRTRPSAEQRLLPDDDHPIPGKCEPRFTLSTKLPARPGGARNASRAGPRVAAARRKRPARAPSRQVFLVTSAASSVGPAARLFPSRSQPCRSQASFLCLPPPPPPRRPLPSCDRGFLLPVEFSPREEKNRRPRLACRLTSAWEGGKERLIQVSQGGAGRGGGKGTISVPQGRTESRRTFFIFFFK